MSLLCYLLLEYWKFFFPILIYFLIFNGVRKSIRRKSNVKLPLCRQNPIGIQCLDISENFRFYKNSQLPELTASQRENCVPYRAPLRSFSDGGKEFCEIIKKRQSIRQFSRKSIDIEVVRMCIEAAATAPSRDDIQPWMFCIVQTQSVKEKIREIIIDSYRSSYDYLTDAPYLILVFRKGNHKKIAVSIAIGILLSAIQCAGLCCLVTTPVNCASALNTLLRRPIDEQLEALLPVGYPSGDCIVPATRHKSIDEVMTNY